MLCQSPILWCFEQGHLKNLTNWHQQKQGPKQSALYFQGWVDMIWSPHTWGTSTLSTNQATQILRDSGNHPPCEHCHGGREGRSWTPFVVMHFKPKPTANPRPTLIDIRTKVNSSIYPLSWIGKDPCSDASENLWNSFRDASELFYCMVRKDCWVEEWPLKRLASHIPLSNIPLTLKQYCVVSSVLSQQPVKKLP